MVNETKCLACETVTSREEAFYDLSLEIEQNCSLTACLRNFRCGCTLNVIFPCCTEDLVRNWASPAGRIRVLAWNLLAKGDSHAHSLFDYGCSATETLDADDKFFCDKCKSLQDAEKVMKIRALPRVLCLHLKRFKYIEQLDRCTILPSHGL